LVGNKEGEETPRMGNQIVTPATATTGDESHKRGGGDATLNSNGNLLGVYTHTHTHTHIRTIALSVYRKQDRKFRVGTANIWYP